MTELLAALLGAIVGGVLSAWIGARQTAKVLKHETDLAAEERREAARLDDARRRAYAADQLLVALADFTTVSRDDRYVSSAFARGGLATPEADQERDLRATNLLRAGSSHAHALSIELRKRWEALTWLVRFNQSEQHDRSEVLRSRDAGDLLNYIEYVRRSLYAVSDADQMPPHFAAPDVRREGDNRSWGFKPEKGSDEPDLTEWQFSSRLTGKVTWTSGEVTWHGPDGTIENLANDPTHADPGRS